MMRRHVGRRTTQTWIATIAVVIGTGVAVMVRAQAPDQAAKALQAAIKLEVVNGNVRAAADEFRKLADHANPTIAADALVRLAACYEKLGHADTRATYERVAKFYASQPKPYAMATAWLAAHPQASAMQPATALVWSGTGVDTEGSVSSDGRYLSFVDWQDGGAANLAVRDLRSGETRLLTRDASWNGYAGGSVFSPDGSQLAYVWEEKDGESVRLINTDGSHMRVLNHLPYSTGLSGWSPDGKYLAAERFSYEDKTSQIVLISTNDGALRQLKSTGTRSPSLGGFSPDGKFLLYSMRKQDDSATGGIYLLATDLTRETTLWEDAANYSHASWAPDGRHVLFLSDRSGVGKLHVLPIANGQAHGKPQMLSVAVNNLSAALGFTRNGAFYYGTLTIDADGYLADLDSATLTVGQPKPVTDQVVGKTFQPVVSPDGTSVAFLRWTTERSNGAPAQLIVRSTVTGTERKFLTLQRVYGGDRSIHWFPDSRTVLLQESIFDPAPGAKKFHRIDLETSAARVVFEGGYNVWRTAALSPDGTSLYYSTWDKTPATETGTLRILRRNLAIGQEAEIYKTATDGVGAFGLTISADGRMLAFSINVADAQRALLVMPAVGGATRELVRTDYEGLSPQGAMSFSPDGREILATARCSAAAQAARPPVVYSHWCAFPVDGSAPTQIPAPFDVRDTRLSSPTLASGGTRVSFTASTRTSEVWVAHNLIPPPVAAR
jgi:Tol biopolymer transport system component